MLAARWDMNGNSVVFEKDGAPRIVTVAHTGPCGACVQQIRGGAYDGSSGALGAEGQNQTTTRRWRSTTGCPRPPSETP